MDLSALNHWQQLAFCTSLCERSMPNFQLFCEIENKGHDYAQSRKILNKVWEFLRAQAYECMLEGWHDMSSSGKVIGLLWDWEPGCGH